MWEVQDVAFPAFAIVSFELHRGIEEVCRLVDLLHVWARCITPSPESHVPGIPYVAPLQKYKNLAEWQVVLNTCSPTSH